MAVQINFKICDNVKECGGIEACSAGALFWDKKNRKIGIDNTKCISCRNCESACPVGAIKVSDTDEEFRKIKREFDEDDRRISDLFVDRYGAMPIDPGTIIKESNMKKLIENKKPILIEIFKDDTIQCLRKSIPIRELIPGKDIVFKKMKIEKGESINDLGVKRLPCLLYFKDGKAIGKIEGYFGRDNEDEFKKKIKELIR